VRIYGVNTPEKSSVAIGSTGSYRNTVSKPCRAYGIPNHLETLNPALKGE
jgi:hypothetical protein